MSVAGVVCDPSWDAWTCERATRYLELNPPVDFNNLWCLVLLGYLVLAAYVGSSLDGDGS